MPNYVWTGSDPSGAVVLREIRADTVQESRDKLIAEGYTNLALQEEDILAETVRSMGDKAEFLGEEIKVTARQRHEQRNKPRQTVAGIVFERIKQDAIFFMIVGLGLAMCLYRHWLVGAAICAALLVGWPLIVIAICLPLLLYQRLADASDWHRWDQVSRLVKSLRAIGRYHFAKIPPAELARFEAKALAGTGHLAQAVALYSQFENQPGAPTWLFKAHLASIFHEASDFPTALKLTHEAIALKPSVSLFIDLANRLARYHSDASGARAALQHVDPTLVVDLSKPFLTRLRGIIAWLENDFEAAKQELELAVREMERTRQVPFRTGNIAVAKGYLCCVYAKLGNHDAARKCYDEAVDYLVATKETQLLEDCKKALALISKN